jgi:hypothetical protein
MAQSYAKFIEIMERHKYKKNLHKLGGSKIDKNSA